MNIAIPGVRAISFDLPATDVTFNKTIRLAPEPLAPIPYVDVIITVEDDMPIHFSLTHDDISTLVAGLALIQGNLPKATIG